MTGKSPAGNGLASSSEPCSDCEIDVGVIDYRGEHYCPRCLATRGVWRAPFGEAVRLASELRLQNKQAGALQSRGDVARKQARSDAAASAKMAAVEATPRKQIDLARLLVRERRANV